MKNSQVKSKLKLRQDFIRTIRNFFYQKEVLEVFTNHLNTSTGTDVYIKPWSLLSYENERCFLHTSPEFAMKRLLAKDSGDIFQICRVYRDEKTTSWHSPEFDMLEWYRLGYDLKQMIYEVIALLKAVGISQKPFFYSIIDLFWQLAGWHPWQENAVELAQLKWPHGPGEGCLATWVDYVLVAYIEPFLKAKPLAILYDYPETHAALAQIVQDDGRAVAKRFEVYLNGIEVANGFLELTDALEQKRRFDADLAKRKELKMPCWPVDYGFLGALQQGLPACSGVAVGLDRVFAIICREDSIQCQVS